MNSNCARPAPSLGAALAGLLAVLLVASACTAEEASPEPRIVEVPSLVTPQRTIGFDTPTGVIRIGIIADLSGPDAVISRSQVAGAEAYWSTVNAGGGVDGRFPVELVIRDTAGSEAVAVVAYEELRERVVMFGQLVGIGNTDAVRGLLRDDGLIAVPTTRHSAWVKESNLLPIGASYAVEALSGVSWMAERDGGARIWCVITDETAEGTDAFFGASLASEQLEAVPALIAIADAGPGDEGRVVGAALELGCERIWLAADAETATRVIAASSGADTQYLIGVGSEISLPLPDTVSGWARDHLIVVVDAPSWGDSGLGARALRDAAARFIPDAEPDSWIRSGFASQYVVDVVLTTSVRTGDLSHDSLLQLAGRLGPIDTGGLAGSPDWREEPPLPPSRVIIHVVDQVGVDPLGLRVLTTYVSPFFGVLAERVSAR